MELGARVDWCSGGLKRGPVVGIRSKWMFRNVYRSCEACRGPKLARRLRRGDCGCGLGPGGVTINGAFAPSSPAPAVGEFQGSRPGRHPRKLFRGVVRGVSCAGSLASR